MEGNGKAPGDVHSTDDIALDEETEDEEVKINCRGGLKAYVESDGWDSEEEDNDVEEKDQESSNGVVEFSCGTSTEVRQCILVKPKPERLSPHREVDSIEEELSESESSSVHSHTQDHMMVSMIMTADVTDHVGDQMSSEGIEKQSWKNEGNKGSVDIQGNEEASTEPSILPRRSVLLNYEDVPTSDKQLNSRKVMDMSIIKAKRVLSSHTLAILNAEAGHNDDSPKRIRSISEVEEQQREMDDLPELSLGLSVMYTSSARPWISNYSMRPSPAISVDDDEDLDRTLSEELRRASTRLYGDNSPVPLLTPPQSPVGIPSDDDDDDEKHNNHYENGLVEWPSNLVVDSAMMAAVNDTRPLSPSSLERVEDDDEFDFPTGAFSPPDPSTLTPLLRSINVGIR